MGVGLRFRNPETPVGDKVEIYIKPETTLKMKRLLSIVGGRILLQETKDGYVHMIIEKTPPPSSHKAP